MTTRVSPAATSGDPRKTLEALRDRLAEEIDDTVSARDVASLSRQLTEVLQKLTDLPVPAKATAHDQLRDRRARRRAAADPGASTASV